MQRVFVHFSDLSTNPQNFSFDKVFFSILYHKSAIKFTSWLSFSRKLIFSIYDKKSAFAVFLLQYSVFCKIKKRLKQAVLTHPKQISHLASKALLSGLFCNFSLDVKLCGGGEGSRTPVRKPIHTNFSGCRTLFKFPEADGQRSNCPLRYFPVTAAVRKKLPPVVHR